MALIEFERQLSIEPEFVTDEQVAITEEITEVPGYYRGYISGLTNDEILGNTHASCGAWTAAEKGGTRYEVIKSGLPGANQVLIERSTGRVVTNSSVTLYFRYKWFARIFRSGEGQEKIISLPNVLLNSGSTLTLFEEIVQGSLTLSGITVILQDQPLGTIRFNILKNGTGSATWRVDVPSSAKQATASFAGNRMFFTAGDVLKITVDANTNNGVGPYISLSRG
jgi:hypothetical protein